MTSYVLIKFLKRIFHKIRLIRIKFLKNFFNSFYLKKDDTIFQLDLNNAIELELYLTKQWEPYITSYIKKTIIPGDYVVEVGANVGAHTFLLLSLVSSYKNSGKVIAIEPSEYCFGKLLIRKSFHPNKNNLSLINAFAGSKTEINTGQERKCLGNFTDKNDESEEEISDYKTIRIDDIEELKNCEEGQLKFIKIDIDGPEYDCLMGAKNTIRRHKPFVLVEVSEFTYKKFNYNIEMVFNFFKIIDYEYKLFGLKNVINETQFKELMSSGNHADVLFYPVQ